MNKLKGIKLLSADGESALIDSLTMGLHHGTVLGEDNILEAYIRSLREKLKDKEHKVIRTVRGAGYRVDLA
ncbi:winged helix-turn-helix domain-containing protein [Bacillus sp. NEAU-CP5]|uniref:winged helix-turn-helix domain-containing protein n=1 Tax=Bacillus TaxID=1386 RepID=UPI00224F4483|nr:MULTISPECIES: winged helix-turn-helix domain-containing protein [Bacillus]MCX3306169.1 winged helix-turn-helix domain-containing protein [Bacillus velezensis]MCX8440769.1 winged helix-turn-helix domain-containing protein [Bacillus sp. NEAU-CP5]